MSKSPARRSKSPRKKSPRAAPTAEMPAAESPAQVSTPAAAVPHADVSVRILEPYTGPPGVVIRRPGDSAPPPSKHPAYFPRATRLRRELRFEIRSREPGKPTRIDRYLQSRFEGYSRTFLQGLIREGRVRIDGRRIRPSADIVPGQVITIELPGAVHGSEDIPFDVIHEDTNILVMNKPAGVLMHPARGHKTGTLYNGILKYFEAKIEANPAQHIGIVHRLDMNTSGVLLIALKRDAHKEMTRQFENRLVRKEYLALVGYEVPWEKTENNKPIGVDPNFPKRYLADGTDARSARTDFERLACGHGLSLILCKPRSGRSHQIRAHLMDLGCPILGDTLYGGETSVPNLPLRAERYLLHARALDIFDPVTEAPRRFEAPTPPDMQAFIDAIQP